MQAVERMHAAAAEHLEGKMTQFVFFRACYAVASKMCDERKKVDSIELNLVFASQIKKISRTRSHFQNIDWPNQTSHAVVHFFRPVSKKISTFRMRKRKRTCQMSQKVSFDCWDNTRLIDDVISGRATGLFKQN